LKGYRYAEVVVNCSSSFADSRLFCSQNGITYAFVVEFETAAERTFYVNVDEQHQAFKKLASNVIEKAIVVDFSDGVF
jgi:hypothetical protein